MKMKHKMYTVWDEVIGAYCSPILAINKGHMLRMLEGWKKIPNHPLVTDEKDKTLFEIGEFDDETGKLNEYTAMTRIGRLEEFKNLENEMGH